MTCEFEAHMAEAWGDAPFFSHRGVTSESEKSFPPRIWARSTSSRLSDEIRLKKEFDHHSPTVTPERSSIDHRFKTLSSNGRVSLRQKAYFSPLPPTSPLLLVPDISLQPPYEDIPTFEECIETKRGIYRREYDSDLCLVIRNMVENIVDKVVHKASEITLRKPRIDKSAAATFVSRLGVDSVSRASSPFRWRNLHSDTRNIAVQAMTNLFDQGKKLKKEHPPIEWSGGVRALRDSHVRLVLRQLKHIERLNRALDRRQ